MSITIIGLIFHYIKILAKQNFEQHKLVILTKYCYHMNTFYSIHKSLTEEKFIKSYLNKKKKITYE
jgi:hypothetical protein